MRHRFLAAFVLSIALIALLGAQAGASDEALPAVLARVAQFRGHLTYRAHPADDPSAGVTGTGGSVGSTGVPIFETASSHCIHRFESLMSSRACATMR